jgi:putative transposase
MLIYRTHKIELKPTKQQEIILLKAVGTARFAYNWALAEWREQYARGEMPSGGALQKKLNAIKREQYPWMYDVPKSVVQEAIKNLDKAFTNFFKKRADHPTFKKKGKGKTSAAKFDNGSGTFITNGKTIKLAKIGLVKMREALRFEGRALAAIVTNHADRWFVSIPVEMSIDTVAHESQVSTGIDLGLTTFCTLSNWTKIVSPRPLQTASKKLQKYHRSVSRKTKGSKNREKARLLLSCLYMKINNQRRDFLHKLSSKLVKEYSHIGIEDLTIKNMLQNRKFAKSIHDAGWYEFTRQLHYKADVYCTKIFVHATRFASSKICSHCGNTNKKLALYMRSWTCAFCGTQHDRDINAAINLKPTVSSTESNACGENGSAYQNNLVVPSLAETRI